jgi:hypothetical protein
MSDLDLGLLLAKWPEQSLDHGFSILRRHGVFHSAIPNGALRLPAIYINCALDLSTRLSVAHYYAVACNRNCSQNYIYMYVFESHTSFQHQQTGANQPRKKDKVAHVYEINGDQYSAAHGLQNTAEVSANLQQVTQNGIQTISLARLLLLLACKIFGH